MCAQLYAFPNTLADAARELPEAAADRDIRGRARGSCVGPSRTKSEVGDKDIASTSGRDGNCTTCCAVHVIVKCDLF